MRRIIRKGSLTMSEFIKIVIAVLCIIPLIYLASSLYSLFIVKSANAQAESTLQEITLTITNAQEGKIKDYLITAPKDWRILDYGRKLCICPVASDFSQEETCQKFGFCKELGFELRVDDFCKIIIDRIDNCISLNNLPKPVYIGMENGVHFLATEESLAIKGHLQKIIEENKAILSEYIVSNDDSRKAEIKKELERNLIGFYSTIDSKALFNVEQKDFVWKFKIIKNEIAIMEIEKQMARGTAFLSASQEINGARIILSYDYPSLTGDLGGGV